MDETFIFGMMYWNCGCLAADGKYLCNEEFVSVLRECALDDYIMFIGRMEAFVDDGSS